MSGGASRSVRLARMALFTAITFALGVSLGLALGSRLSALGSGDSAAPAIDARVPSEWDSKQAAQERADRIWDFFNARPVADDAYSVLFVGNSLTAHPGRERVWLAIRGMAASCDACDYVHRFSTWLQQRQAPRPVEIFLETGAGLAHAIERLTSGPLLAKRWDLVVIQRGENDNPFDAAYRSNFQKLLRLFDGAESLVVMSDWYHADRWAFQARAAEEAGAVFVDLSAASMNPEYRGYAGPFDHPGVATHPNDAGMAAIARTLSLAVEEKVLNNSGQEEPE